VSAALLGFVLLGGSLLPSDALAGRLLGTAGEAGRSGIHTQELLANFGIRLRFAGTCAFALAVAVWLVRASLAELFAALVPSLRHVRCWRPRLRETLLVLVVTLGALGLRLAFINQPMRYDEALTFNELASRPLYYGLSYYPDPNNHLLNTLLVHVAYLALGNQPWVIRLPALVAGTLLAPATYWLTRELATSQGAAVLAAALVAGSSYLIEYSTNSRGYTLQALCFVAMFALVARPGPGRLLLAAVVAALGAYALPTMLYGVAIVAAWLMLLKSRPPLAAAATLLAGLVYVLYLPVLLISGPESLVSNRFVVPLDAAALASELPRTLASTWTLWNRDVIWPLAVVLVVGFALATARDLRARRVPLGLLAPAVCLVLVLLQRVAPFERVWLFLLPLYFAVAAIGLARVGYALAPVAALALGYTVLASGSILASTETGVFPDAQNVAMALRGQLQADDAVVTELPASLPQLQYYFPRAGLAIETLVRDPSVAEHVYVVVPPGRGEGRRVASFATADVVELER
jgi:hypothetical protein